MNELLAQLEQCYADYLSEAQKFPDRYPRTAGLLGVGYGPKNDPAHEKFYYDAKTASETLAEVAPDPETALAAAELIIKAAEENSDNGDVVMMLVAAQAHAIPLIEFLLPEDAAALSDWYDRFYERRTRLPVQKEVGKALKKRSSK